MNQVQLCPTLSKIKRQTVYFDVSNPEHIEAFKLLCLGEKPLSEGQLGPIKQHHTLRFELEAPFTDVRTMLMYRVAERAVKVLGTKRARPSRAKPKAVAPAKLKLAA